MNAGRMCAAGAWRWLGAVAERRQWWPHNMKWVICFDLNYLRWVSVIIWLGWWWKDWWRIVCSGSSSWLHWTDKRFIFLIVNADGECVWRRIQVFPWERPKCGGNPVRRKLDSYISLSRIRSSRITHTNNIQNHTHFSSSFIKFSIFYLSPFLSLFLLPDTHTHMSWNRY